MKKAWSRRRKQLGPGPEQREKSHERRGPAQLEKLLFWPHQVLRPERDQNPRAERHRVVFGDHSQYSIPKRSPRHAHITARVAKFVLRPALPAAVRAECGRRILCIDSPGGPGRQRAAQTPQASSSPAQDEESLREEQVPHATRRLWELCGPRDQVYFRVFRRKTPSQLLRAE